MSQQYSLITAHDSAIFAGAPELKISDYMEMMDRELAGTTIGESFIKDSDPERQAEKPQVCSYF